MPTNHRREWTDPGRRPRVLLLSPYFHPVLGGAEAAAMGVARYLHTHGYPTFVVTKRIRREHPVRETVEGVPVRRIPPVGRRSGYAKWVMLPSLLAALIRWRREYDVVCCVDFRGVAIAAIVARGLTRRPVAVQAQTTGVVSCGSWDPTLRRVGLSSEGVLARAVKWPVRTFYVRADAHACLMKSIERESLDAGVPADRVHYVPQGVNMETFHPAAAGEATGLRAALGWPADRLICLSLARLSLEKGALDLLDAWNQLRPPNATLVLAGPDMENHPWDVGPQAREFVRQHDLGSSVVFHGPTSEAPRLMRAADIFVLPSHFEALSVAAIEAAATALPIVATAVGGIGDYTQDGVNGLLVPPRDSARMAEALGRLLTDAALRARLGRAARASVEARFSEDVVFGRLAGILTSLAASRMRDA
jgi:glycosyltransferase involved in cell wall biosynthesis